MPLAEEPAVFDGETPFNAVERYRLRQLMKNFEGLEPGDVSEIKRIAQSGKVVKGAVKFVAWFFGTATTALVLLATIKSLLAKGG